MGDVKQFLKCHVTSCFWNHWLKKVYLKHLFFIIYTNVFVLPIFLIQRCRETTFTWFHLLFLGRCYLWDILEMFYHFVSEVQAGNHASMSDKCMLSILNILDKSSVMFIAFFCLHKNLNIPGCNLVPAFWHIFVKILNPAQPGKSLTFLPGKPSTVLWGFCLYFTKSNSLEFAIVVVFILL